MKGNLSTLLPIKRAAMQVHHGFYINCFGADAVNDGVRKAMEVELAIFAAHFAPTIRFSHDAAQRAFKLVQKVVSQTRLPFFIPQRPGRQFLFGFRMADDAYGACDGCPLPPRLPDGS